MATTFQFGPWAGGVYRKISDKAAPPSTLYGASGLLGSKAGSLVGMYDGVEVASLGANVPTRWLQWGDVFVQLASKPTSEVIVKNSNGLTTLLAGDARGVIYDDKLFLAIPGQQSRVYTNPADLTQYAYVSEKVQSFEIGATITGAAGAWTVELAGSGEVFLQEPQYVMFDRDADAGGTLGKVRTVTSLRDGAGTVAWSIAQNITHLIIDDPTLTLATDVVAGDHVRVYIGESSTDTLMFDGFVIWRERLCGFIENRLQFAGFPGAGTLTSFQEPNELDWTVWDGLNFRVIGEESKHGTIRNVVGLGDYLVCGLSNSQKSAAAIATVHGYPAVNAAFGGSETTMVAIRDDETGFESYDAVAVDVGGASVFWAYGGGFWSMAGTQIERIDDGILDDPLFPRSVAYATVALDFVWFAEGEFVPTRVASPSVNQGDRWARDGFFQQFPAIWAMSLLDGSWYLTQRVGSVDGGVKLFDSPGRTGGLGLMYVDGERHLAVGSGNAVWTVQDQSVNAPAQDRYHLQRLHTHRHDYDSPLQKVMDEITVQVKQRFGLRLPVVVPAEGNTGVKPGYVSLAKIRDQIGDMTVYHTYGKGGRGSSRISLGLGYYGEHLLAGQVNNVIGYTALTLTPGPGSNYLMPVTLSGRADRIDVQAANVSELTVLVYDSDNGVPGNLRQVVQLETPRYGLSASPDFYWFPFDVGALALAGDYFIEVRGDADIRRFGGPTSLVDLDGVEVFAGSQLALRVVQMVGGYYVCDEIFGAWATFELAGEVTW